LPVLEPEWLVSAVLSRASQPGTDPISGPGLLLSWTTAAAAAAGFPLDAVLAGMVAAGQGIHAICLYLGLTRPALDDHLVRLGLRTPHERALRKPGPRGWSVLDTIRLIAWRLAGIHPDTIALRLGRSANAVRAKARRLGIPRPDRKALQRVDPERLQDPVPGFGVGGQAVARDALSRPMSPSAVCGTSAGLVSVRVGDDRAGIVDVRAPLLQIARETASGRSPPPDAPSQPGFAGRKRDRGIGKEAARGPKGQLDLPLFPALPGTASPAEPHARSARDPEASPAPAAPGRADRKSEPAVGLGESGLVTREAVRAIPQKKEEVCLPGDLTWIGRVRKPLGNQAVVWALGMLYFGGLHWTKIAERIGKRPRATSTLLQRCDVPNDYDRSKFGDVFDEELARANLEISGFELAEYKLDERRREYFWRKKKDRATVTRNRIRRRAMGLVEPYWSERIELITRRDLDAMRGRPRAPFAENIVTMRA
jgi:hypothetical protein